MNQRIEREFQEFDRKNPHVWAAVLRFAEEARASGRKRFGIKMIYERIRWFMNFETTDKPLKLNNNYTAHYARKLIAHDPVYSEMLMTRGEAA